MKYIISTFIVLCYVLSGCEKSEIISYESIAAAKDSKLKPGVVFDYLSSVGNKETFSFLGHPTDVATIAIPVSINGFAADRDRNFEVEVVTDTITDASTTSYEILRSVIHAGRLKDTLFVNVKKTEEIANKTVNLYLRIKSNSEFDPGIIERQYYQIAWSDQFIVPAINTYFRMFFTTAMSTRAYRIFVETTGLTAFALAQYRIYLEPGSQALGRLFGDYIRAYNEANPDDILLHDDGTLMGRPIVPVF